MKLIWHIEPEDIAKVNNFFAKHRDNLFVKKRIATNLREDKSSITKEDFWECLLACLLTTQQRSGPRTPVTQFIAAKPFPLALDMCRKEADVAQFVTKILSSFGGLRRWMVIGKQAKANLAYLESGGWEAVLKALEVVRIRSNGESEREAANFLDNKLQGFGPKQSRNLLQGLGLSRFEIPIDSRITKWLNDFGFPVQLTANGLADRAYYEFVSDGFQRLSESCGIAPCVLDAAIFSSFDKAEWTEANIVW